VGERPSMDYAKEDTATRSAMSCSTILVWWIAASRIPSDR
jgi:hypothetical protein